jgi:non-ribosomal peptide synthase protein (TIGR01720 family)
VDWENGNNTAGSVRRVTRSLSGEETRALLEDVPSAYQTQINVVLLAALVEAMGAWTGERALWLELEGHGREDLFDEVDVSRTVGWFTSLFPVYLDVRGTHGPGEALTRVKEQLRRIPKRGIGYGLLRYLCRASDVGEVLRRLPAAEVSFNYFGQYGRTAGDGPSDEVEEDSGPFRSGQGRRLVKLEISARVARGSLAVAWMYSEDLHRAETIEQLATAYQEALRDLIRHCQSPEAGGYTPSDFARARVSQQELDQLLQQLPHPASRRAQ